MFANFLRSLLLVGAGLLWSGVAHAQAACPPGQILYGSGNGLNMCGPDNRQQSAPQPPAQQWERRWGAIATSVPDGVLGVSTDLSSKREASRVAVQDCQSKGGLNCKIETTYDNQCAAVIVGDGAYNAPIAATADKAVEIGMKICRDGGLANCHVYYSACSLPVRVR